MPWSMRKTPAAAASRPTYYTLTYDSNGGTQYDSERYRRNTVVQLDKVPTGRGIPSPAGMGRKH